MHIKTSSVDAWNRGRFCNDSKIGRLISKRLSVENKAKLSTRNSKHLRQSIVYLHFPVERVSLCSLHKLPLKLVCQFRYCHKIYPCWYMANSQLPGGNKQRHNKLVHIHSSVTMNKNCNFPIPKNPSETPSTVMVVVAV